MNTLTLPHNFRNYNGWNWTLCKMLEQSKMFKIIEYKFPQVKINGARNGNWSLMKLEDILIGLDTWDTISPTSAYLSNGFFDTVLKDVKLLIKIQHHQCKFWNDFEKQTGIPSRPWTVMPCHHFPLRAFDWLNQNHKWITTVTGKNNRFGRQPWSDWCENNDDFYSSGNYLVDDNMEDYINRLKNCKWGTILKGKRGAEKNRRECEFTSCGMPLALNYTPSYPFEMIPDKHFVLLKKPDDLAKLRDIDPLPYHMASKQLYYDHFSPYGMAKTLIKLVESL